MSNKPNTDVRVITPPSDEQATLDERDGASRNPLNFLMSLSKRGDIAHYATHFGPVYLINHPDAIHHVFHSNNYVRGSLMKMSLGEGLITSDGSYWHAQRRAMQPLFHQQSIAAFDSIITDLTMGMLRQWRIYESDNRSIDMAAELQSLTLKIISKALFGADLAGEADHLCDAINKVVEDTGFFVQMPFMPGRHVSRSRKRQFEEALQTIDRFAYDIIENHRRNTRRSPLCSMLL